MYVSEGFEKRGEEVVSVVERMACSHRRRSKTCHMDITYKSGTTRLLTERRCLRRWRCILPKTQEYRCTQFSEELLSSHHNMAD